VCVVTGLHVICRWENDFPSVDLDQHEDDDAFVVHDKYADSIKNMSGQVSRNIVLEADIEHLIAPHRQFKPARHRHPP